MSSAPHIRTGNMRQRAELQFKEETKDGGGGVSVEWIPERFIWCEILPLAGTQRIEGMQRESEVSHTINARWAEDITPKKRLVHRDKVYNIEAVFSPEELREFIQIIASEGVAT